jgi:hypothetical protein
LGIDGTTTTILSEQGLLAETSGPQRIPKENMAQIPVFTIFAIWTFLEKPTILADTKSRGHPDRRSTRDAAESSEPH